MILMTGATGYIGSHTALAFLEQNYPVILFDNLSNSSIEVVPRIEKLAGKKINFIKGDLLNKEDLELVFSKYTIDCVVHFAGLKSVKESHEDPLRYYHNNVTGSILLIEFMTKYQVKKLVFSSSATVYGPPQTPAYSEEHIKNPMNPYGRSKWMIEQIIIDYQNAHPEFKAALLRYFNPVGAHPSGHLGEHPRGTPNNLMPFISQVAVGLRPQLQIFGRNYNTKDGTGARDYIHVMDLAEAHLKAFVALKEKSSSLILNVGTGKPYTVLEVINAFEQASGVKIPFTFAPPRAGDLPSYYADPSLAKQLMGWTAQRGLKEMCQDTWKWQKENPTGYEK